MENLTVEDWNMIKETKRQNATRQDPRITLALEHKDQINKNPNEWATFECMNFGVEQIVVVKSGRIHSNGMKERRDVTRYYFIDKRTGIAYSRLEVHP